MRYNVIDRETAMGMGYNTTSEHNRFALVTDDGVLCWGYKRENLEVIAAKRNEQLTSLQDKMNRVEQEEVQA